MPEPEGGTTAAAPAPRPLQPGDWACKGCKMWNRATRTADCAHCFKRRALPKKATRKKSTTEHWRCWKCQFFNFVFRPDCKRCQAPKVRPPTFEESLLSGTPLPEIDSMETLPEVLATYEVSAEEINEKPLLQLQVEELVQTLQAPTDPPDCVRLIRDLLTGLPNEARPLRVQLTGGFAWGCVTERTGAVDLLLTMPPVPAEAVRQGRYLRLRAEYVECLRQALATCPEVAAVAAAPFARDPTKTFLTVTLRSGGPPAHLFIGCQIDGGNASTLEFLRTKVERGGPEAVRHASLVLEDLLMADHLRLVSKLLSGSPGKRRGSADGTAAAPADSPSGILKGCNLVKLWASQREFHLHDDAVNGFLLTALVAGLVAAGDLIDVMPPYQVFRHVLTTLATRSLMTSPVLLASDAGQTPWRPSKPSNGRRSRRHAKLLKDLDTEEWGGPDPHAPLKRYATAVVLDPAHAFNFLFRVTPAGWREVQQAAQGTLLAIDSLAPGWVSSETEAFKAALIHKAPFWRKWDYYITITPGDELAAPPTAPPAGKERRPQPHEAACARRPLLTARLEALARQALGFRATEYRVCWDAAGTGSVVLALRMAQWDVALSAITKGPELAQAAETAEFAAFWGPRVQHRRFRDGAILNTVVWVDSLRHFIPRDIMRYVLGRHLGLAAERVVSPGVGLLDLLTLPVLDGGQRYDPMEVTYGPVFKAFDALRNALQGLHPGRVPVTVSNVWAADPALRKTAPVPPLRHRELHRPPGPDDPRLYGQSLCVRPIHVVIEFSAGGGWPNNIDAMAHMKRAVYIAVGKQLWFERGLVSLPRTDSLDVLLDGYVFRVSIRHRKELSLLQCLGRALAARDVERRLFHQPLHHQFVKQVADSCASYSHAVRLALHWMASHMLLPHFSVECVELLMAYVYLHPHPYATPTGYPAALQRFWTVLATFDWELQPMVLRFPEDMKFEVAALKAFEIEAKATTLPPMWIATRYAVGWSPTTAAGPSKQVLQRAQAFASQAAARAVDLMAESAMDAPQWERLFTTSLRPYHLLVEVNPTLHPFSPYGRRLNEITSGALHWLVDYDVVRYLLGFLQEALGAHCAFFVNPFSGLTIGAVAVSPEAKRDPSVLAQKIAEIGRGIIKQVTIQKSGEVVPGVAAPEALPSEPAAEEESAVMPEYPEDAIEEFPTLGKESSDDEDPADERAPGRKVRRLGMRRKQPAGDGGGRRQGKARDTTLRRSGTKRRRASSGR